MTRIADREEFDHDREYVVFRGMRFAGVDYVPGQDFPRHLCNTRKLRQLYDQRWLNMREHGEPYRSPTARFDVMSMDELRDWLSQHGTTPRVGWDRAKLLEKAAAVGD